VIDHALEQRLHTLVDVFLEENAKVNLSAFRTPELCYEGNVLDSLPALEIEEIQKLKEGDALLDIGTGGGFPLLPLAICLPHVRFVGMDSTQKKLDAIGRIVTALELQNVELVCGRAEELGHDAAHRAQYAIVTGRAVAPLNVLLEFAAPFTKVNGHVIAWKSMHLQEELQESLRARSELHCHLTRTHRYSLSKDFGERQLLVFTKTSKTSAEYPRDIGIPKKHPLL
jgi:16S rRNA (guanine527-N7)-methyltransferase